MKEGGSRLPYSTSYGFRHSDCRFTIEFLLYCHCEGGVADCGNPGECRSRIDIPLDCFVTLLLAMTIRNQSAFRNPISAIDSFDSDLLGNNLDRIAVLVGEGCVNAQCWLRSFVGLEVVLGDQCVKPGGR